MSGSSVSSSWSARMPSTDTTVSKPRTARLDRIRSTMLGSSSTTRAHVLRAASVIAVILWTPWILRTPGTRGSGRSDGIEDFGLDGQVDAETGALGQRGQLDSAAMSLHDSLGDGQAKPGSGVLPVARAGSVARASSVAGAGSVARASSVAGAGSVARAGSVDRRRSRR